MKYLITNLNSVKRRDLNNGMLSIDGEEVSMEKYRERYYPDFKIIKSIDDADKISDSQFLLVFSADDEYLYHLEEIIKNNGEFYIEHISDKSNYLRANKNTQTTIANRMRTGKKHGKRYIQKSDKQLRKGFLRIKGGFLTHINICQALDITKNVDGCYVEIGVYTGGSSATALEHLKTSNIKRKCYLLDTFEGFDYSTAKNSPDKFWSTDDEYLEIGLNPKLKPTSSDHWIDSLNKIFDEEYGDIDFKIIKSDICADELPSEIDKIACANIDVDLLEATESALHKISERLSVGGIIICEDPASTPACIGSFYAMEKFLNSECGKCFVKIHLSSQYFLLKIN